MPVPPVYSPTLQPSAWWGQAQKQITGLPGLPTPAPTGQEQATWWESLQPHRSALANLYQQSMQNPQVGQQPGESGAPATPIPTEAGSSALGELMASAAGVSRYGTSPLAGLPSAIDGTTYTYGKPTPVQTGPAPPPIQGWMVETPALSPYTPRPYEPAPGGGYIIRPPAGPATPPAAPAPIGPGEPPAPPVSGASGAGDPGYAGPSGGSVGTVMPSQDPNTVWVWDGTQWVATPR